jgi:uncharacterized membrane protein YphA (DoxX/SURF4 family)
MTPAAGERLARVFYVFCVAAGVAVLAGTLLSAAGLVPIASYPVLFRALIFRFGLVLAAGVLSVVSLGAAALREDRTGEERTAGHAFAASPYLLRGLCVSTALGFVGTSFGKLLHDSEMRAFFTSSGYPVWFLYVVIAVETIGAIGLLMPSVRLVAACGLALVMIGAVFTHTKNGDPLSDSWEALHMFAVLGTIVLVGVLRDRKRPSRADRAAEPRVIESDASTRGEP